MYEPARRSGRGRLTRRLDVPEWATTELVTATLIRDVVSGYTCGGPGLGAMPPGRSPRPLTHAALLGRRDATEKTEGVASASLPTSRWHAGRPGPA